MTPSVTDSLTSIPSLRPTTDQWLWCACWGLCGCESCLGAGLWGWRHTFTNTDLAEGWATAASDRQYTASQRWRGAQSCFCSGKNYKCGVKMGCSILVPIFSPMLLNVTQAWHVPKSCCVISHLCTGGEHWKIHLFGHQPCWRWW